MNSKAYHLISELLEHFDQENGSEFELSSKIRDIYWKNGKPEDCKEQYLCAMDYLGKACFWGWDGQPVNYHMAWMNLTISYGEGNKDGLEELGYCYFAGYASPDGSADKASAMRLWKEGIGLGDKRCALRWCLTKVEDDEVDDETIGLLEKLATDKEDPVPDAAAALYFHYRRKGEEDKAREWREKAIDMDSVLMQSLIEDEAGEEEKCVIIADTDDDFRIVAADASDWRSLPALIGAERCDDMRCQKFRDVSRQLGLPGTLLGQLDKDAFRKPNLELNYHASQWYDGMADLAGDMVICLEDQKYNPFSFSSRAQAQQVIDALCNRI